MCHRVPVKATVGARPDTAVQGTEARRPQDEQLVVQGRAFGSKGSQFIDEPSRRRRTVLGPVPLMPEATRSQETGGVFTAAAAVDVEERADGPVLVVLAVRPSEIAVQVGRQVLGVLVGAEACEGKAVALAREAEPAGQEQVAEDVAEVITAVETDQPSGREAGAPFALQQDLEFFVGDLVGGSTQGLKKEGALALVFSREVGVEKVQVAPDPLRWRLDIAVDDIEQLEVRGTGEAHEGILASSAAYGQGFLHSWVINLSREEVWLTEGVEELSDPLT